VSISPLAAPKTEIRKHEINRRPQPAYRVIVAIKRIGGSNGFWWRYSQAPAFQGPRVGQDLFVQGSEDE